MARPRTLSDETILTTTRAVLLERGPAVSVSVMAKRVGLSAPALLARFGSKAALVRAALAPPSPRPVLLSLQQEPRPEGFPAQLAETLEGLGRWLERALPCQILLEMSPDRPAPSPADDTPRIPPSLTIWFARAQARGLLCPGDPQLLAATALSALRGHALARFSQGQGQEPPLPALTEQLGALLLSSPGPRDDTPGSRPDRPAESG